MGQGLLMKRFFQPHGEHTQAGKNSGTKLRAHFSSFNAWNLEQPQGFLSLGTRMNCLHFQKLKCIIVGESHWCSFCRETFPSDLNCLICHLCFVIQDIVLGKSKSSQV